MSSWIEIVDGLASQGVTLPVGVVLARSHGLRQCAWCSFHFWPTGENVDHCSVACRMKAYERRCLHCRKLFNPKRKTAKYCKPECRMAAFYARRGAA